MTDILLYLVLGLQAVALILILVSWRRQSSGAVAALKDTSDELEKVQERLQAIVRDEMGLNRRETGEQARASRDEAGASALKLVEQFGALQRDNLAFREHLGERLSTNLTAFAKNLVAQIDAAGLDSKGEAAGLRAELLAAFSDFNDALTKDVRETTTLQDRRFERFEQRLVALGERNAEQIHVMHDAISERLESLQKEASQNWETARTEELAASKEARLELHEALGRLADSVAKNFALASEAQRGQFDSFAARVDSMAETADSRAENLRGVVDNRLQLLQDDNARKLEEMRRTVDEKLQGTLNERLGESFRVVSERLELVHAELGEMQSLAQGVGDLKRVLSDVKTRGNWGEIQLGGLLEAMLSPQQYQADVATVPGSDERADFAIRLPGQNAMQETVWLPIDASFSQESYERLLAAQQNGDRAETEKIGQELEAQLKERAEKINRDYVRTPHTTDFAILFLPTEGLYAEVIRRANLIEVLQREYRVTVAGPTTLTSILNALQMGFRTLAIQERSREVWGTLSAVKTEFGKYGEVLDAVQRKLKEASTEIDQTRQRSRAIERQLEDVETPAEEETRPSLPRLVTDDGEARKENAAGR